MAEPDPPWTPEWRVPETVGPPPRFTLNRRGRFLAGATIAVGGHVIASGLWFFTLFTFAFFTTPDPPTLMIVFVILLQLVLLFGCLGSGLVLLVGGDRGLGAGLLAGWAAGVIGAALGTGLLYLIAQLVEPAAS